MIRNQAAKLGAGLVFLSILAFTLVVGKPSGNLAQSKFQPISDSSVSEIAPGVELMSWGRVSFGPPKVYGGLG